MCVAERLVCGGGGACVWGGESTHTAAAMNDHYYTLLRTTSPTSSIHVCKKKQGKAKRLFLTTISDVFQHCGASSEQQQPRTDFM